MIDKVGIRENRICSVTFPDGVKGRFECRGEYGLHASLSDHMGKFYSEKFKDIEEANEGLHKFEIELEYVQ